MSPRTRVVVLVTIGAAIAAGIATVGAVATRDDRGGTKPRKGLPLLVLDLGLRTDPAAQQLRRGAALYDGGKTREARALFARVDDPQARVGESLARWPNGSLAELEGLAEDRPRDPVVLLNLAIARVWAGDDAGGVAELRRVKRVAPDSLSAVRADDLLHPKLAPDLPTFVQSAPFPRELARLPAPKLFAALERRARSGRVDDLLRYGVALQRLGRPVSAERVFAAAARAAPDDPEAQTAAAVGRFDKDDPARAFSRLGPLTQRFPHAATVRFHLGLLLLWIGQPDQATKELRLAQRDDRGGPIGREAKRFLDRLESVRGG